MVLVANRPHSCKLPFFSELVSESQKFKSCEKLHPGNASVARHRHTDLHLVEKTMDLFEQMLKARIAMLARRRWRQVQQSTRTASWIGQALMNDNSGVLGLGTQCDCHLMPTFLS